MEDKPKIKLFNCWNDTGLRTKVKGVKIVSSDGTVNFDSDRIAAIYFKSDHGEISINDFLKQEEKNCKDTCDHYMDMYKDMLSSFAEKDIESGRKNRKISSLRKKLDDCYKQNTDGLYQIHELMVENERLKEDYRDLKNKYNTLKFNIQDVPGFPTWQYITKLKEQNAKLKRKNKRAGKMISSLKKKGEVLDLMKLCFCPLEYHKDFTNFAGSKGILDGRFSGSLEMINKIANEICTNKW